VTQYELTFACMGTDVRLIGPDQGALEDARAWLHAFDRRLSRFRPDSELSALNRDGRRTVPSSKLLRAAIAAGLWAARATGGLVDPTVLPALRRAGYTRSLAGVRPASLDDALAAAPPRAAARPQRAAAWRAVRVDDRAQRISRPPRIELDTGAVGKGLAADTVVRRLGAATRLAVDCGGDVRVAGTRAAELPFEVELVHPFTGETTHRLWLGHGAIATSGIDSRLWQRPDGSFAHHLLDPSTGAPAWTGLVSVTALGPTALEAETIAKAALLSGPPRARKLLAFHGGVLVRDDGDAEPVGSLSAHPVAA
jgi:thiamine biosynthesis lipoprotein